MAINETNPATSVSGLAPGDRLYDQHGTVVAIVESLQTRMTPKTRTIVPEEGAVLTVSRVDVMVTAVCV